MNKKHLISTAIVSYILFVLVYVPASAMVKFFNDSIPHINIEGATGTIWDGSAQRVTLNNQYILDNANWSVCTWRLIIGEACIDLTTSYDNNILQGEVGINVFGTLIARNLQASLDAKELGITLNLPVGELSGDVSLNIETIKWNNEQLPDTDGAIKWRNASITLTEKIELGLISVHLSSSDEFPVTAMINNKDGQISVEGHTNISDDGTYALELRLKPGNNASSNLRKNLRMFTKKQPDGSYLVENSGNLKQLGII